MCACLSAAVGYDGALKMWDQQLQLVASVKAAHEGTRVHCLTVGADNNLYTGGDEKVWARRRSPPPPFVVLPRPVDAGGTEHTRWIRASDIASSACACAPLRTADVARR